MSGLPPPNILTYEGQVAVPFINRTFDPTTSNYQFNVPTIWVNTAAERGFILLGKPMNVADWFPFSGGSVVVESLQGNSGGPVPPTGNIINVVGDGTTVTTVGNPGTSTLTIQAAGGLATTYDGNSGSASPSGGALNILAASPNAGSSPSSTSASGNTVTVNVQKAQSIASTDATKIGLAAFNSADFSVDANGFVSATGAVALQFTGNTGTATPSSGNINVLGSSTAPGTSPVTTAASGSTVTVDVQKSQAIASTSATNVGLAAFDSAFFTVDSNGFVSFVGSVSTFTWIDISGAFSPTKNHGYFITGTATGTLPASPAQGDTIKFFVDTTSIFTVQANTGQIIRLGSLISSSAGTATNSLQGDSIELVYRASDTCWCGIAGQYGTWTMA